MSESTVEWLAEAIGQAARSTKFCVAGRLPDVDPGIEVEGLGPVRIPLKRGMAKELIACCRTAPYGKGSQTLVNKRVRNTYELAPKKFRLSDAWDAAIATEVRAIAEQLGLPPEQLQARLYKLLVYQRGGFFLPHRDSEKHDRMVASLSVVLPNRFEGGALIVRHGAAEQRFTFGEAAAGKASCYAAFYADCEHEVQRVTKGVRLCLTYNLVLQSQRTKQSTAAKRNAPADMLAGSIESWITTQPARPLVFALDHHYTQRGLSLDLLKGRDRQLADLVVEAADMTDCFVHLAQVTRHLLQFADDGSFERGYSRSFRSPRRAIEVGETYEDQLSGTQWTDVSGKKQPWGEIAFDPSAIVSSVPIDDWKPSTEEFEGYTGNAGNTLDRWYHRSAIVVWYCDHHFEVIAGAGAAESMPAFLAMVARLAKTPKKWIEGARAECVQFARAIIGRWPRPAPGFARSVKREESPLEEFPQALLTLHDRDTIAMFLAKLAERDQALRLKSFVLSACREFGWSAFAEELKQLLTSRSGTYGRDEIPFRDVEWLSAFCCAKGTDAGKAALARELCGLAVERFCESPPPRPRHFPRRYRREPSVSEKSLPLLVKALVASGNDQGLSTLLRFVQESPDEFRLEECQVPCLKKVVPWSQKQQGAVHPQLASWLAAVRQHLESVTASRPEPPTDWARPAKVDCTCRYCAQLKRFLADPTKEVERIAAREDERSHVVAMIDRHQCDVEHALERKGRPYSLVLTKTTGSFERAAKQFDANSRLLRQLPKVS